MALHRRLRIAPDWRTRFREGVPLPFSWPTAPIIRATSAGGYSRSEFSATWAEVKDLPRRVPLLTCRPHRSPRLTLAYILTPEYMAHSDLVAELLEKTARIRKLNDEFRRTGRCTLTSELCLEFERDDLAAIIWKVRTYRAFKRNYRYSVHNSGAFEYNGTRIYWMIDCFDLWSCVPDSSNPDNTRRVLTVMLPHEL